MTATIKNTVFITAANKAPLSMHYVINSARLQGADPIILDARPYSLEGGWWSLKMGTVLRFLTSGYIERKSIKYVVFFDAFDVIFLKPIQELLDRFNSLYTGVPIFNADLYNVVYPFYDICRPGRSHLSIINKLSDITGYHNTTVNSGIYIGEVDKIVELFNNADITFNEFIAGSHIEKYKELYVQLDPVKCLNHHSDQLRVWIYQYLNPGSIAVDSRKDLFSVVLAADWVEPDIDLYRGPDCQDRLNNLYVGDACLVHAPGSPNNLFSAAVKLGLIDPSYNKIYKEEGPWVKNPGPGFPSFLHQLRNVFGAAIRFSKSGFKLVNADKWQERYSICQQCEHFSYETSRCRLCGCFAKIKNKLASEECPEGRWN